LSGNSKGNGGNMKFRELNTDHELDNYRHAIHKHIDVLFPLDYLKQGQVFGLYTKENEICGGFAIITSGPFRVLSSIPEFDGFKMDYNLSETAELTGVWLSNINRNTNASLKFWLTLIYKILSSEKKYFVYAYTSDKTHLERIYSKANPVVLFRGETIMLPGMDAPEHESIEVLVKSRLFVQAIKNSDFFLKRFYPNLMLNKIFPQRQL
jgi:hypothetical protein